MSNNYHPDKWILVEIKGDNPHYKAFGCWSGGYLHGDSWRMNSGITEVYETDTSYVFVGSSGSKYHCAKEMYGLNVTGAGVLKQFEERYPGKFLPMYSKPDVMNLKYLKEKDNG